MASRTRPWRLGTRPDPRRYADVRTSDQRTPGRHLPLHPRWTVLDPPKHRNGDLPRPHCRTRRHLPRRRRSQPPPLRPTEAPSKSSSRRPNTTAPERARGVWHKCRTGISPRGTGSARELPLEPGGARHEARVTFRRPCTPGTRSSGIHGMFHSLPQRYPSAPTTKGGRSRVPTNARLGADLLFRLERRPPA